MPHDDDGITDLEARRRQEWRAPEEAGGGVSEGFELAEQDLIENASDGDELSTARIIRHAGTLDEAESDAVYGEADGDAVRTESSAVGHDARRRWRDGPR